MKNALFVSIMCFALPLHLAQGASPGEEARFLSAAKQAFEKHDVDALMELTCWDGVTPQRKEEEKKVISHYFTLSVTEVAFVSSTVAPKLRPNDLNLPITKYLKVTFAPDSHLPGNPNILKDSTLPLGEKDGKLYILQAGPAK